MTQRRVIQIEGENETALQDALSGGFLFTETSLVVIETGISRPVRASKKSKKAEKPESEVADTWETIVPRLLLEHSKEGSNDIAVLVHHADDVVPDSMVGKIVAGIPKTQHLTYPAPKTWDMKKYAISFLQAEIKRHGKTMPEVLVEGVVQQVGTDIGLLALEVLKISTLLDWDGRTEVTRADLVGMLATFGLKDQDALRDAIGLKDERRVISALSKIRNGAEGDMFAKISASMSRSIVQWLYAAALRESGVPDDEAAVQVGLHPYPYKKDVLPPAIRWGRKALVDLLRAVTSVAVRKGFANPWVALEGVLILACVKQVG